MISSIRERYNQQFSKEKYLSFLSALDSIHPGSLQFRVAETPVFVGKAFGQKIISACENIIDIILQPDFISKTENAIPPGERVPLESSFPQMLCFDFAVCRNENGELEPQLIEMQGFPTMYAFQAFFPDLLRKYFDIPSNFSHYFNGLDTESYLKLLKETVVGDCLPEEVVLLEVKPYEQKTLIDFLMTKDALGIELVCITELIAENGNLFYKKDGRLIQIKKIYNRIIFDELHAQRKSLGEIVDLTQPYNVEWIPHPNWFYRVSKFTLPLIQHPFVPETHFLSEIKHWPTDLSEYVLKPLFSFAGQGVKIDLTLEDLNAIKDPSNYILQKKVKYADIIATPDGPAKTEIRMMYLWKQNDPRPIPVTNLARLSKGKMIGVRYNADKEWVGGTVAFFEQ
jgi:hypothetical protein